jgi:5-methyltetrahydrofolate--homocysteine methyltransferase
MNWEEDLKRAVLEGDEIATARIAAEALDAEANPQDILQKGAEGIIEAGKLWQQGDYFLPDVILAAEAYREVMDLVAPLLEGTGAAAKATVLIGSVEGDAHEIGKNIVVAILRSSGYRVVDLGVDVRATDFVEKVKELEPQVLGLGAYMTTTMRRMPEVMEALQAAGLRDRVKVMVGGAPLTTEYAESIGADGYGADAYDALAAVDRLLEVA